MYWQEPCSGDVRATLMPTRAGLENAVLAMLFQEAAFATVFAACLCVSFWKAADDDRRLAMHLDVFIKVSSADRRLTILTLAEPARTLPA
mmetsp:Transcript_126543/g.229792  ORF Transcript_126543/g.229792 Transcript_126543/m.229792 type:complete len:90 (-) Transcript_126543:176-445(-)